jgi:GNAT superfamily N-acetyltransferase
MLSGWGAALLHPNNPHDCMFTIRAFMPEDYAGLVQVHNAIYPLLPASIDDYHRIDRRQSLARWVAVQDGRIVGAAQSMHSTIDHIDVGVAVIPAYTRQGIGSALCDRVMAGVPAWRLLTHCPADHVTFFQRRGFREYLRENDARLDLVKVNPADYDPALARMRGQGIVITTADALKNDSERDRKLYDLATDLFPDVPGQTSPLSYADWLDTFSPDMLPGGYVVAVRGTAYIGQSILQPMRLTDHLHQRLTGVRQAYRRRGVALAMKIHGIRFARASGFRYIVTSMAVGNVPMLALNRRLGFETVSNWVLMEKVP